MYIYEHNIHRGMHILAFHTCIHAYMHTCIHAYRHTCIHAYRHTCIHAYRHKYINAYIHTYIHTYMHTYTKYSYIKFTHIFGIHSAVHSYISLWCNFFGENLRELNLGDIHTYIHNYIHSYIHQSIVRSLWRESART